jgi:FixJ family two-component response regulator
MPGRTSLVEAAEHTVLFVDDEPSILSALRRLCRREEFQVAVAGSGPEALALLERTPAQVILSDYRMPGMTGVEFLARAKEIVPGSIRIILSGFADTQAVVEAINKGEVYRFLAKPWDDHELLATIQQGLEHHDLREQNELLQLCLRQQNEELQRMNEQLESLVAERTTSLNLAQDVLEQMPVGVLGVGQDGEIALANACFAGRYAEGGPVMLGAELEDCLPAAVAVLVRQALAGGGDTRCRCDLKGRPVALTITNLHTAGRQRGSVVVFQDAEGVTE